MIAVIYFVAAVIVGALIYFGVRFFVRTRARFGGGQMIVCPETGKEAMVEVDAGHATLTSLIGQTDIRLESCWRWPLNEQCGQECLIQLHVAEPECLVRGVLMKWYKGKRCAFCRRPFDEPHLIDHKPALLSPEGVTLEWSEVPAPGLMEVLKTHEAVCWNCHIAQTFRRVHPDLVVDRTYLNQPPSGRPDAAHRPGI
jgi:hypothetical protein